MFIRKKKITAFGLLLLVAIPLFFSVAVLVKQKIIHYLREERFDTELLQTIAASPEEFHWVKQGKEIMIEGKLFDVKSYKTEADKVLLTGFFDDKEDNLLLEIKNITHPKNEPNSPINQLVAKFIFTTVYNESTLFYFQNPWYIVTSQFSTYTEVILKGYGATAIHPPEYC